MPEYLIDSAAPATAPRARVSRSTPPTLSTRCSIALSHRVKVYELKPHDMRKARLKDQQNNILRHNLRFLASLAGMGV